MSAVLQDPALVDEAAVLNAELGSGSYTLHLFKNNQTPSIPQTTADYTEADFPGYTNTPVILGSVAPVSSNSIVFTTPSVGQYSFVGTGGPSQDVYGWYITDPLGQLYASDRFFGGPFTIVNNGDTIAGTVFETLTRL